MSILSRSRVGAKALAMLFPHFRELDLDRTKLIHDVSVANADLRAKEERISFLEKRLAEATQWGNPSYSSDCLRVWSKNPDFLKDEKFMRAYRAGVFSGHKLGGANRTSEDIHIEWRIHVCCWAAKHASHLEGDFVECGTNTGIMSLAICNYIDFDNTGKHFYLFDTFCGIPEEQILPEETVLNRQKENANYEECYEIAERNFRSFRNAHLVRGIVPDTLSSQPIERICYLMLDMNIVLPEQTALKYFWDKLVPGGIVLFDDYGWLGYIAQKRSHDAFAESKGVQILNLPTGQGMLIKP